MKGKRTTMLAGDIRAAVAEVHVQGGGDDSGERSASGFGFSFCLRYTSCGG